MQLQLRRAKVEFFSSIKQLPFDRFQDFNRYSMLDSEIGSTLQDFDKVVIRINEFVIKDLKDEAKNELLNLRLVVNNMLTGTNHKGMAFACLVKKIDDKYVDDYSEDGLKRILKKLSKSGLNVGDVVDTNSELKKK